MLNCNDEIWKTIPEFEGYYEVSNKGNVKSLERVVPNSTKSTRIALSKGLFKGTSTTSPYLYVKLRKDNQQVTYSVHRLVATCFCHKPESALLLEVNHKDGNVLNNASDNLEWITRSENLKHKFKLHPEYVKDHAERMKGTKFNAVSKYHNVSWDKARQSWIASIKHNKKLLFQKRFKNEIDAALYVNEMLDHFGLTDRPKNIIT